MRTPDRSRDPWLVLKRAVAIVGLVAIVATLGGAVISQSGEPAPAGVGGLAGRYEQITQSLRAESDRLRSEAEDASGREGERSAAVLELYGDLLLVTERARDAYASLEVADNMKAARQRLVNALDRRVQAIDRLMVAARAGDKKAADAAARDIVATAQSFAQAQSELLRLIDDCGAPCR